MAKRQKTSLLTAPRFKLTDWRVLVGVGALAVCGVIIIFTADASPGDPVDAAGFTYYSQVTPPWKTHPYIYKDGGKATPMSYSGCVPTAMAMVAVGRKGDSSVTPASLADRYGSRFHTRDGTEFNVYPVFARDYGLKYTNMGKDFDKAGTYLASGKGMVIANVGPGFFTREGHAIILRKYSNGKFLVADPHNKKNNRWFTKSQLRSKANIIQLTGFE